MNQTPEFRLRRAGVSMATQKRTYSANSGVSADRQDAPFPEWLERLVAAQPDQAHLHAGG